MASDPYGILLIVAMVVVPLVIGIACIAGAVALGKKKDPNDPAKPSTGRNVVSAALGCSGLVMLIIALGFGACFGTAMFQR